MYKETRCSDLRVVAQHGTPPNRPASRYGFRPLAPRLRQPDVCSLHSARDLGLSPAHGERAVLFGSLRERGHCVVPSARAVLGRLREPNGRADQLAREGTAKCRRRKSAGKARGCCAVDARGTGLQRRRVSPFAPVSSFYLLTRSTLQRPDLLALLASLTPQLRPLAHSGHQQHGRGYLRLPMGSLLRSTAQGAEYFAVTAGSGIGRAWRAVECYEAGTEGVVLVVGEGRTVWAII